MPALIAMATAGVLLAQLTPTPTQQRLEQLEQADRAAKAAEAANVRGKEVTPFLLQYIVEASNGKSLEVNLDLARNNVSVAADIALAYAHLGQD